MPVRYEKKGKIAFITLDRPELNIFDRAMHIELHDVWCGFRDDPELSVAVLTGAGERAFCASAEPDSFQNPEGSTRQHPRGPARNVWETRFDFDLQGGLEVYKPIVAAINGYCIAEGLTLALACDLRIASERATFQYPEIQGGIPTIAGAIRLPRVVGLGNALELLLLGDRVSAQRAHEMGLVNKVVPHEKLMAEATRWAERLAANAPIAMAATKEVAYRAQAMAFGDALRMGEAFRKQVFATEDCAEGAQARQEKRTPVFRGR